MALDALAKRIDRKIADLRIRIATLEDRLRAIRGILDSPNPDDIVYLDQLVGQSQDAASRVKAATPETEIDTLQIPINPYAFADAPKDARYKFEGEVHVGTPEGGHIKTWRVICEVYGQPTAQDVEDCMLSRANDDIASSPGAFGLAAGEDYIVGVSNIKLAWKNF